MCAQSHTITSTHLSGGDTSGQFEFMLMLVRKARWGKLLKCLMVIDTVVVCVCVWLGRRCLVIVNVDISDFSTTSLLNVFLRRVNIIIFVSFFCLCNPTVTPQITLRLGSNLRHSHIQEGNDVYFECAVRASPWVTEVRWHFEGKELQTNTSAGVIVSNQSLVLQKVRRAHRGKYTCSATNIEGEGVSNPIHLRVQFAPLCRPGKFWAKRLNVHRALIIFLN